jgi:hypothetical protein
VAVSSAAWRYGRRPNRPSPTARGAAVAIRPWFVQTCVTRVPQGADFCFLHHVPCELGFLKTKVKVSAKRP